MGWCKCWHVSRWNGAELDYNQDEARQTVVNWIDGTAGTSCAFDFPTKGILQEAVKNCQYWRLRDQNGKPPGVIGYYPKRAVTFIDNHDTGASPQPVAIRCVVILFRRHAHISSDHSQATALPWACYLWALQASAGTSFQAVPATVSLLIGCHVGSTQQHWPFPEHRTALGYAYLFTHPGNPTIFWDHYFNSHCRETIDQLIALRKRTGVNAGSKVQIQAADDDFYVARIDDK